MTPADLPPSGPLSAFRAELQKDAMAIIGGCIAALLLTLLAAILSTPLPSQPPHETGKRANASGEGMRNEVSK